MQTTRMEYSIQAWVMLTASYVIHIRWIAICVAIASLLTFIQAMLTKDRED